MHSQVLPGTLDVNKALDYCAEQTQRTLTELENRFPALTIRDDANVTLRLTKHHWNYRATKEEWCRLLAGVFWYDYEYTQDKHILKKRRSLRKLIGIPFSNTSL